MDYTEEDEWAWDCGERDVPHMHQGPEDWVREVAPKIWPQGRVMKRTPASPWVPDEPPLCNHCGRATADVRFVGSTALCAEPCFALVTEGGHPATALRRGPCPDCAEEPAAVLFVCGGFNCPCNDNRPCRDPKCPHYEPAGLSQKGDDR